MVKKLLVNNGKIINYLVKWTKITNFGQNHGFTLQIEVFRPP